MSDDHEDDLCECCLDDMIECNSEDLKSKKIDPFKIIDNKPVTMPIVDALIITNSKIQNYEKIQVSISGGSDSDIMLDMCSRLDVTKKIKYVFFDTGIEYKATRKHLEYLEKKYDIAIARYKAEKPVPLACRKYGVPFLSKQISEFIFRLQRHGFEWENDTFEVLSKKYPRCISALKWWCNEWGERSSFNIQRHKYLKEFLISNPPNFSISPKCCIYAKKNTAKRHIKTNSIELVLTGIRQCENGARSQAYKNCFTAGDAVDYYRPIFWFSDNDKKTYAEYFSVTHSDCYETYGLTRTGCAGCPFGSRFEEELKIIEKYEPELFKAVNNIFGKSYDYTRRYRAFKASYKPKMESAI